MNIFDEVQTIPINEDLEKFINEDTDLGKLYTEILRQYEIDFLIYGRYPWDYIEEFRLNLINQGYWENGN
jgi:hypothetical protein